MDYNERGEFDSSRSGQGSSGLEGWTPERDQRAIGNKVISTPEIATDPTESAETEISATEVRLTMPLSEEPANLNPEIVTQAALNLTEDDTSTVKTDDSLSSGGEHALKKLTNALEADEITPEDFYESSRDLADLNLSNSYADREASRQRIQEKQR